MPNRIQLAGDEISLSPRIAVSTTIGGSPPAGAETVIATVNVNTDVQRDVGVLLIANAAFTVGTSGVSARLRVRQTNISGTVVADTGATTAGIVAAALAELQAFGLDAAPAAAATAYVLTLLVGSGSAASTVSAVFLAAVQV